MFPAGGEMRGLLLHASPTPLASHGRLRGTAFARFPAMPAMPEPGSIELVSVAKQYGRSIAIDSISLRVPAGAYCCLLGPSGCGKTTTLRIIAGHETATAGTVRLGGDDVTAEPPGRRGTAMMFQSYALFPHLTCLDNVAFSLKLRGEAKAKRRAAARLFLERVRMDAYADRLPAQLSGGQQQRVALARALITGPRVLLLDEPLSALDPELRVRMREELKRIQREFGITFVHVTHTRDEAMALSDLVVLMNEGRIVQAAHPRDVFERPANAFAARFIGGHNVLPSGNRLVAVRADKCRLAPAPGGDMSQVFGRIAAVEYQGAMVRVAVDYGESEEAVALVPDSDYHPAPVTVGDPATLAWSPEHAYPLS